jgi:hypothetical protein
MSAFLRESAARAIREERPILLDGAMSSEIGASAAEIILSAGSGRKLLDRRVSTSSANLPTFGAEVYNLIQTPRADK